MKKVTPWLVLALVFVAGLVVGGASATWHYKSKVERFLKDPGPPPPERIVERLDQVLHLTEEQKPRVQEVFESHQDEAEATRKQCQADMDKVLEEIHKELAQVLNADQQGALEEFVARIKERGRPGPPPGGMPGPAGGPEGPGPGGVQPGTPMPGDGPGPSGPGPGVPGPGGPDCRPCPPCDQPPIPPEAEQTPQS